MSLNWNMEVFFAFIGFVFFLIFCLMLAWFTYKKKTKLYIFTLLTFSFFAAYHFFEATAYLFLSFELKRMSMMSISIGLFCLILNIDFIAKERVGYYKIILASFLIGVTIVLIFIPGNIQLYTHEIWGYPTLGMKGPLRIIIILTFFILCFQIMVWLFKTWYKAPPELKKDAFILFISSLVFYICCIFLFLSGLWLIFPMIYIFTTVSIIILSFFIYRQPKLLYILSFKGQRISILTNVSGIPLFDLSWQLNRKQALTEPKEFIKWVPVLQQLSKKISTSRKIEELKLGNSTILFINAEYVTVILVSSRSSLILREALKSFIKAFESRYNKLLKTGMTETSYFQESTELINEFFPLGTVSAKETTGTLESYLDELVKQRIHELEQTIIRAQEMDRLKSLFIATIGHELRTPLNSILGFTEILMSGYSGNINEKQYEQLNTVYRSGEYLLNLINRTLDISKIEAGKFEINPEEFKINKIINDVVQTLSTVITQKNINLKMDLISNIRIYSDEECFKQILFNLVSNALKFTHKKGVILIKTRIINKSKVDVHIIDNGIGISKEDMNKLFKPFQQIDSSISKCYDGTGLGLYLTKNLVNILEGEISVKSEKGKGSIFSFSIPIKISLKKSSIIELS